MSKKITVKQTTFTANANVVYKNSDGELSIENSFETVVQNKSARNAKRATREHFIEEFGSDIAIIAISDISVTRTNTNIAYRVIASNAEIIAACENAGLQVEICTDTVEESEESENA